jgi:hypothetical protein
MPVRRRHHLPGPLVDAFWETVSHVERAKDALLATVPSPRGVPGPPLAEALVTFESALRDARASMDRWLAEETAAIWEPCFQGVEQSMTAAELVRVEAPNLDYEGLVSLLDDLLRPLEAFEEGERFVSGRR